MKVKQYFHKSRLNNMVGKNPVGKNPVDKNPVDKKTIGQIAIV